MEDIVSTINDINKLHDNVNAFSLLSADRKLELLQQIAKVKTEAAGRFLTTVYAGEKDKVIQKAIRKLLFILKTVGIEVEEPHMEEVPVLKKVEPERTHRGFLSNYDNASLRLVLALIEVKRNNFILMEAITHFADGLLELTTAPVNKSDIETLLAGYRSKTNENTIFQEISMQYAVFLMAEGSARSGKFAEEIRQIRQFLSTTRSSVQKPEDLYILPTPEQAVPQKTLQELLDTGIFEAFQLSWEGMDEDKKEYQAIGTGTIVFPAYVAEEKKDVFLKTLIESDKMGAINQDVKRMLEDYAYIFYAAGQLEAYMGTLNILNDSVAMGKMVSLLVRKTIIEKTGQQESSTPGLIVSPYEQVRS